MRSLSIAVSALLLVSISACSRPGGSRLLRSFDNLESCTTVNAGVFAYGPGGGRNVFTFDAQAMHLDTVPRAPVPEATFTFSSEHSAESDTFGSPVQLALVMEDGTRLSYPGRHGKPFPAQHLRDGMLSSVYFRVPAGDLRRLARASNVRGRIGEAEFVLDSAKIAALRQLADFMARSPGAPVPVPGDFDQRDCDSYAWSPNYAPYDPAKDDEPRR